MPHVGSSISHQGKDVCVPPSISARQVFEVGPVEAGNRFLIALKMPCTKASTTANGNVSCKVLKMAMRDQSAHMHPCPLLENVGGVCDYALWK